MSRVQLCRSMTWVGCATATAVLIASEWHFRVTPVDASASDSLLGAVALLGTSLTIALPGLVIAAMARARWADLVFAGWLLLTSFFTLGDALVYGAFGRHLVGLWGYARAEGHWAAAGGGMKWLGVCLTQFLVAAACVVVGALPGVWIARRGGPSSGTQKRALVAILVSSAIVVGLTVFSAPLWASGANQESTFEAFTVDLRLLKHPDAEWGQIRILESQLSNRLRGAQGNLRRDGGHVCVVHQKSDDHLPSVVIVVVESFRTDALTDELMPRLSRFARGGLRLDGHLAGSILSEAGMFGLLFSQNPLLYDWMLDGHDVPCATHAFTTLGYTTAYFSGQPEKWRRMDEFINAHSFDVYHHDDRGEWPDWDERALRGLIDLVRSNRRPVFGVAYLMSSHFPYQFPKTYGIDQPAATTAAWPKTNMRALGRADAKVLRNRYRNTMRFLDDTIMNAIDGLDPKESIVVVVGDHGESLYDDERIGHGYSFADVVARTPAIVVGKGIAPARREDPTLHADLLPTVLSAATGGRMVLSGIEGRDLQRRGSHERGPVLLAADDVGKDMVAQLRSGDLHLDLRIRWDAAAVTWDGLRDPLGKRRQDQHVTVELSQDLFRAFDAVLRETENE